MNVLPLVLLVAATSVAGATGIGVTDTWQAATLHDPIFAAARAQWEAGRTHASQARALWLPTLSAQGSAGRGDQQTASTGASFFAPSFGATPSTVDFQTSVNGGTATQWAFVAEQPLYDAARIAGYTEQKNAAAIAEAQFRQAQQDLMLRSARAYFAVLNSRSQLEALQRLRAAAEQARGASEARFQAGDIPATDMREAQATTDAIGVQELDARTALTLSEAAFTDLTGLDPVALRVLPATEEQDMPVPEPLEAWTQRALAGSPQLAVQRLALSTASAQTGRYGLLNATRVSLVAQAGRESLRGTGDFGSAAVTGRQASVAVQATIPLFTGGERRALRHEARALEHKASAELEGADQQVRQQARAAWLGLTTAAARVRALQQLHASTNDRLGATQLGVEIGDRTALELLNAESDYLRSGTDFQRAQADWLLAGLQLQAVAGALTETDLQRVDQHLSVQPKESP